MYNKNEILGFETDTVWGIGTCIKNKEGVNKIYELKSRDKKKPLILMSSKFDYIIPYVKNVPEYAEELIKKYWPGALTLIFQKTNLCPLYVTSGGDTVGVRIPNHKGFFEIAENVETKVLATTSLNISDDPPVKNYAEAITKFGNKIKIIKPKAPNSIQGIASAVVLCTKEKPVLLRSGNIVI